MCQRCQRRDPRATRARADVVLAGRYLGTFEIDGVAAAACEALARLAANPAAHRTLQAAATFQTALGLLGAMLLATVAKDVTVETEEMVRGRGAVHAHGGASDTASTAATPAVPVGFVHVIGAQ